MKLIRGRAFLHASLLSCAIITGCLSAGLASATVTFSVQVSSPNLSIGNRIRSRCRSLRIGNRRSGSLQSGLPPGSWVFRRNREHRPAANQRASRQSSRSAGAILHGSDVRAHEPDRRGRSRGERRPRRSPVPADLRDRESRFYDDRSRREPRLWRRAARPRNVHRGDERCPGRNRDTRTGYRDADGPRSRRARLAAILRITSRRFPRRARCLFMRDLPAFATLRRTTLSASRDSRGSSTHSNTVAADRVARARFPVHRAVSRVPWNTPWFW